MESFTNPERPSRRCMNHSQIIRKTYVVWSHLRTQSGPVGGVWITSKSFENLTFYGVIYEPRAAQQEVYESLPNHSKTLRCMESFTNPERPSRRCMSHSQTIRKTWRFIRIYEPRAGQQDVYDTLPNHTKTLRFMSIYEPRVAQQEVYESLPINGAPYVLLASTNPERVSRRCMNHSQIIRKPCVLCPSTHPEWPKTELNTQEWPESVPSIATPYVLLHSTHRMAPQEWSASLPNMAKPRVSNEFEHTEWPPSFAIVLLTKPNQLSAGFLFLDSASATLSKYNYHVGFCGRVVII